MDLQGYLKQIEITGELRRVRTHVDTRLELAALCRREFRRADGGRALLFEQVSNSPFPVAANLFGSDQRASLLLHSNSFLHFSEKLQKLLQTREGTVGERLFFAAPEKSIPPEKSDLHFTTDLKLTDLPAIQSWPEEGGNYLNLAMAITEYPKTGSRNLGLYRAQVLDADHLAVNFAATSGAAEHLRAAEKMNQPLPVSLFMGSDPALLWAAAAPLPHNCDEFRFIQALFNIDIKFAAGFSQPLAVPADAEMIIEGEISPGETATEGPFGNHTGQYVTREDCPVMRVTAICHRPQPIVPVTVVGPPPSENIQLGRANEILLREMVKIDYPQITDLSMPLETIFHGVALLAVKPQSEADIKELIYHLWDTSPLCRSRLLVILDNGVDIRSAAKSWWRTINSLNSQKIYQDAGRMAIDASGVNPASLVVEDRRTEELLLRRRDEYRLW